MKKQVAIFIGIIALAMTFSLFTGSTRAAGTEVPVEVKNNNPSTILVTFVGLQVRQFQLAPGKNTIELEPGPYQHSYYGCGKLNFGNYTVKAKNNEFTIENCNNSGGTVSTSNPNETVFTVRSRSSKTITLSLVGQINYQFSVPAFGKTEVVVVKGVYQLSYYDCGKVNVETYRVKKDSEYVIKNCSEPEKEEVDPDAELLKVTNNTYQTFTMYLFGVSTNKDYEFTIYPGPNKLYVRKGTYSYSYFACSNLIYGTVNVTSRGGEMYIYSCSSQGNGQAQTNALATFKVKNNTGETIVIQMVGPINYLFTIKGPGANLTVQKGFYQYTMWACGTTIDGVIQITPTGRIIRSPYCSIAK